MFFFLYLFEDGGKPNWPKINLVAKIGFWKASILIKREKIENSKFLRVMMRCCEADLGKDTSNIAFKNQINICKYN